MFTHDRLVSLRLSCRVQSIWLLLYAEWGLSEVVLDPVVDRKVDGPCREVAKDGRSKPAVHATKAVMRDNIFDGR